MLVLMMYVVQAPQTLGGRGGKSGPREGFFDSSDPSTSKNQADCLRLCRHPCHGGIIPGPGKFFSLF